MRLIPVILTRHLGIGLDDMFQYDMLARSLALGHGFRWYAPADLARIAPYLNLNLATLSIDPRGMPTTFRAPLYPAFLAIIYYFNGVNEGRFFAARLAQTGLGAFLAPLTFLAARHVLPNNERAARVAAWLVAAYPMLLIFPIALATENLFFLLVLVSALFFLKVAEKPTTLNFLLSGFFLGLAALTRSIILGFGFLAILWVWFLLRQRRGAILSLAALLVTVTPWIVRNSLLEHKLTGIETSLGYNLYVGYYPQSSGTFTFGPSLDLLSILDDKTRDEVGTQEALQFIEQDPARFPVLAVNRLGYFFDVEWRAFTYFYVNDFLGYIPPVLLFLTLLILGLPFVIVALSSAFGAVQLPWRPQTILLALLFIGYLLPHVFILSEERFHLALVPFFAIVASGFWVNGFAAFKSRPRILLWIALVLALLLVLNWSLEIYRAWPVASQMLGPDGNKLYLPY